jgi:hypothetical protein
MAICLCCDDLVTGAGPSETFEKCDQAEEERELTTGVVFFVLLRR